MRVCASSPGSHFPSVVKEHINEINHSVQYRDVENINCVLFSRKVHTAVALLATTKLKTTKARPATHGSPPWDCNDSEGSPSHTLSAFTEQRQF